MHELFRWLLDQSILSKEKTTSLCGSVSQSGLTLPTRYEAVQAQAGKQARRLAQRRGRACTWRGPGCWLQGSGTRIRAFGLDTTPRCYPTMPLNESVSMQDTHS